MNERTRKKDMGGCGGVVKCGIVKRACTKERENIVPDYCRFPLLSNLSEKGRFQEGRGSKNVIVNFHRGVVEWMKMT